jgi:CDP-6-deoxy-D-xylo-4-hexulose-3-dehydrase
MEGRLKEYRRSSMIKLVKNTISDDDISHLIAWLGTNPRLTKGKETIKFEEGWSEWLGMKHSVYVNSGSSANLALTYALKLSGRLKNKKVIVPAVSWATTVSPIIQFGLQPILCDSSRDNLGLDIDHLKELCRKEQPAVIMLAHVLGLPCHLKEIVSLCKEEDILLIEDTCESVGSLYDDKKLGTFGLASSFSFYYGHHLSTIEGGMICTNDTEFYHIIKSLRCHGWDRDLDSKEQQRLREEHNIDDFRALYSFYYPGFNLRSTDLQAFIGQRQLAKLDEMVEKRRRNFLLFEKKIQNDFWRINVQDNMMVSNMAYPIITPKIDKLVKALRENNIETRPLVCGSIGEQPFWKRLYGETKLPMASLIHKNGLYVPNNHELIEEEIELICEVVNDVVK